MQYYGSRIFFCGDELYLMAGLPLHDEAYYEGYPQIENGVGMITSMRTEFYDALEYLEEDYDLSLVRECALATGKAAYPLLCELAEALMARVPGLTVHVYQIENNFFGSHITVAGLITGGDLRAQLSGKALGARLILPDVMLRHEKDLVLDDVSVDRLEEALGTPIRVTATDGCAFIEAILGE